MESCSDNASSIATASASSLISTSSAWEELPHPKPERAAWRMLRIQTGGIEHVGAPLGRLASVR